MGVTSDISIIWCTGIFAGLLIGYIAKSVIIIRSNIVPVEINSVSEIPDFTAINSRPASYQSNEWERPLYSAEKSPIPPWN